MRLLTNDETFSVFEGADSGKSSDDCDNIDKRKRRDDCYVAVAMCGPAGVKEHRSSSGWSIGGNGLSASSTVTVVCKGSGGSGN